MRQIFSKVDEILCFADHWFGCPFSDMSKSSHSIGSRPKSARSRPAWDVSSILRKSHSAMIDPNLTPLCNVYSSYCEEGGILSIFMTIWQIADTEKLIENYLLVGKYRRIWVNSRTLLCKNVTSAYHSIEKNIFYWFSGDYTTNFCHWSKTTF